MNGMSRSESGKLGAEKTKQVWLARYADNPRRCFKCDAEMPYKQRHNKFCSHSCSASCNNVGVNRKSNGKDDSQNCCSSKTECKTTRLCLNCQKPTGKNSKRCCSNQCNADYKWTLTKAQIEQNNKASSHRQGKRYIAETYGHRCQICNIDKWNNQDLPMVLDHIDGNSDNNSLDNLRLVCSNCDSQLPTYKNRNKGRGRYKRKLRYSEGKSF